MDQYQGMPIKCVDEIDTNTSVWFVSWGSRTIYTNPTWRQRMQVRWWRMSDAIKRLPDAWAVARGSKVAVYDHDYEEF